MSMAIQDRAIALLWKQWTVLGVAGVGALPQQAVDLEALIAFTPFVASSDPRLVSEAADWCARIGRSFLSMSRLRQILKLMPSHSVPSEFDLPAVVLGEEKLSGRALSGKSRAPKLEHPSLLQLRSRFVFGVSARADALARLAMKSRVEGGQRLSEISPSGYTKVAVATMLDELAQAGVLKKHARAGSVRYELSRGEPLRALLAPLPRRAPPWAERFAIAARILEAWRTFGERPSYAVELAKVLDALKDLASVIGVSPPRARPKRLAGLVEHWVSGLLDDDIWENSWTMNGHDLAAGILNGLHDAIVEAVQAKDYPVGYTQLSDFEFKVVDREGGQAEYVVRFSAEHPREDFSFHGHVEGVFSFDPHASKERTLLESIVPHEARAEFDMGDPP